MTPKHLCLLLLALVAISTGAAQNEDELQIPEENDNQFPPDKHSDVIDGSGDGVIEEPEESDLKPTEASSQPLETTHTKMIFDDTGATISENNDLCPKPCVCRIEGTSNDFIVDCSGYDLTDFPTSINENATVLLLQKNKLKEIPKDISTLKKLKTLNADDNLIMDLAPGSVSELPVLVTLKLKNNRLIEYPNDLKNSFGLTQLEELDLSGNDMRTELSADVISKFEALRTIILPSSTEELNQNLCAALPKLIKVCTESCENKLFECQDDGKSIEDLAVIPGMIPLDIADKDNADPEVNMPKQNTEVNEKTESRAAVSDASPTESSNKEFSFRSAVNKQPSDEVQDTPIAVAPKDTGSTESSVKVGATTTDTNTGGVDKSIIGLVVAGMVVIVAGITIKKNWSSIKKRFSSNSQTPNERNGTNANGTTPEEVPLQNKSPV